MLLLLMDKIVEFDRTDKTCHNPRIADTTVIQDDPAVIQAVKANKKKGKGKDKGKGKGNIADTNVAANLVQPPQNRQRSSANSATSWGT
jgi:hypothetical protein